jgi:hypothetical protein
MMHERFRSIIMRDESKTFTVVKPFHSSLFHFLYPPYLRLKPQKVPANKKGHKVKSLCGLINGKNL